MVRKKIFFILIISSFIVNAENIDSLKQILKNDTNTHKIIIDNINLGEALLYNKPKSAQKYARKALKLSEKENNDTLINEILNLLGYSFELTGKLDSAEIIYKRALKLSIKIEDLSMQSDDNSSIGNVFYYKGEFNKALRYYQISLGINEKLKDTFSMGQIYHNIGLVHNDIGNIERALEYYNKALKIFLIIDEKEWLATCYNSLASVYVDKKDYNKGEEYYLKSIENFKLANDNNGLGMVYSNYGVLKMSQNRINDAEEYFTKSIEISKSVNDIMSVVNSYLNMANLLSKQKIYYKSLEYCNKALYYSKKHKFLTSQETAYSLLKDINFSLKNYRLSALYSDSVLILSDSIFDKEKFDKIEEMESKYQTVQNKLKIDNLEKSKELQSEKISKQKFYIYTFILGLIIVLIFLAFIIRLLITKQKINSKLELHQNTILEKNEELNQLVEEVTTQKDEIEIQREKLIDIHSELTQSIAYAEQIQNSILPNKEILDTILDDNFIFFKPKDIVSGDFYWFTQVDNKLIITVVDCTGHGVPGAFMSMLGSSLLRETIIKEKITSPSKILNILRTEVITALQQKGEIGEQKDGMDMALISIDLDSLELNYAGANNPIYIITNKILQLSDENNGNIKLNNDKNNNVNFYEVLPDKMPIAHFIKMNSFTNKTIKLHKGDSIYLFSDGYPDQFGGLKNRKFKYKPFKELLINNFKKHMSEQNKILEKSLREWQGTNSQVDDITIVGVKL